MVRGRCGERPSAKVLTIPVCFGSQCVCQKHKAQTFFYLGYFSRLYFSSNMREVRSTSRTMSKIAIKEVCAYSTVRWP